VVLIGAHVAHGNPIAVAINLARQGLSTRGSRKAALVVHTAVNVITGVDRRAPVGQRHGAGGTPVVGQGDEQRVGVDLVAGLIETALVAAVEVIALRDDRLLRAGAAVARNTSSGVVGDDGIEEAGIAAAGVVQAAVSAGLIVTNKCTMIGTFFLVKEARYE
jgi:hypothetical protein